MACERIEIFRRIMAPPIKFRSLTDNLVEFVQCNMTMK
jgi:hypothetical protein